MIAPVWQAQPWYPLLLEMLIQKPILLPTFPNMLTSPTGFPHPLTTSKSRHLALGEHTGANSLSREAATLHSQSWRPGTRAALQECLGKVGWLA